jgi:hypothetical protein
MDCEFSKIAIIELKINCTLTLCAFFEIVGKLRYCREIVRLFEIIKDTTNNEE